MAEYGLEKLEDETLRDQAAEAIRELWRSQQMSLEGLNAESVLAYGKAVLQSFIAKAQRIQQAAPQDVDNLKRELERHGWPGMDCCWSMYMDDFCMHPLTTFRESEEFRSSNDDQQLNSPLIAEFEALVVQLTLGGNEMVLQMMSAHLG